MYPEQILEFRNTKSHLLQVYLGQGRNCQIQVC